MAEKAEKQPYCQNCDEYKVPRCKLKKGSKGEFTARKFYCGSHVFKKRNGA